MARPGVNIISRSTPPSRSAPTDVSVWFAAGFTQRGPLTPTFVTSMDEFERQFGDRVAYSQLFYDGVETFFREASGGQVYVGRVVGPAPAAATITLQDTVAADTLTVTAKSPGDWANGYTIDVVAGSVGGTYVIVVKDASGNELDRSLDLTADLDAVSWAAYSDWVTVTDNVGSALAPAVVTGRALAGGTDDRTNALDAQWQAVLDTWTNDLGPGQVSFPGRTTGVAQAALLDHAANRNRVALLDPPDTGSKSGLASVAGPLRSIAEGNDARYGALFAPWVKIPGLAPGTLRTVPPSAFVAGLIARNDAAGMDPGDPAAGDNGQATFAVDITQPAWADLDRQDLNDDGVNVIITLYGGVRNYGFRTLVDPVQVPAWVELGHARLYMAIAAKGDEIAQGFVFDQIDGRGILFSHFQGALKGMLAGYYNTGALYGATPDEAFVVDVGPSVNTPARIANRELHAVLGLRMSPMAELVTLEIVKVPITQAL